MIAAAALAASLMFTPIPAETAPMPTLTAGKAHEVMTGAPRYASRLRELVLPALQADVAAFERWADQGLIRRVDFTHLMFLIWSSTQGYADLGAQYALLLGKPALQQSDYEQAERLIVDFILAGLRPA